MPVAGGPSGLPGLQWVARRLPGIMPELTEGEAVEVTRIQSVAEDRPADQAAEEGAGDADQHGDDDASRIGPGVNGLGDQAGDEAEDDP